MGDLHRHAEIFEHVQQALARIRPDEDYICLELGNYLTDVSQFRDPFAQMKAKRMIWRKGYGDLPLFLKVIGVIPVVGTVVIEAVLDFKVELDEWLDMMLGSHKPAAKRHGQLAAYMSAVVEGVTHMIFADDVTEGPKLRNLLLKPVAGQTPLPPTELQRIFGAFYTQYFPHEHSDFPPYVLYGEHRPNHRLYRRGSRGLSNYLEEYIDYLAESLSKIEVDWKAAAGLPRSDPKRHDVLLRLGKVLHGIEDFFFHSNYLELHLWHSLRRGRRSTETDEEYRAWFAANIRSRYLERDRGGPITDVVGDSWRPSPTHQVRAHLRRLRYPAYRPVDQLDRETSLPSLDHLYTAGFDAKDLNHTLGLAMESIESSLRQLETVEALPVVGGVATGVLGARGMTKLRDSELVLVKTALNKHYRSRMARDEDFRKGQLALHKTQVDTGLYEAGIQRLEATGHINASGAAAWRRALAIDKAAEAFNEDTPGSGIVLITFLTDGQKELEESRKKSRRFDQANDHGPGNIFDIRSSNGASGEHIGNHALMAKDTQTTVPVHEETRRVARFASMAVVTLLASEVSRTTSTADGLDWDVVLRHYLRFPAGRANMWESQVLEYFRTNRVDPTFDQIPDRLTTQRASGPAGLARLAKRRGGTVRADLEKRYVALEERVDHIGKLF
jgi:hypothetical protein